MVGTVKSGQLKFYRKIKNHEHISKFVWIVGVYFVTAKPIAFKTDCEIMQDLERNMSTLDPYLKSVPEWALVWLLPITNITHPEWLSHYNTR